MTSDDTFYRLRQCNVSCAIETRSLFSNKVFPESFPSSDPPPGFCLSCSPFKPGPTQARTSRVKVMNHQGDAHEPFQALIADRDPMSSDLLARALEHERVCKANAVPPSDLLEAITRTQAKLVVLGADLRTDKGDGFSLALAVERAFPAVSVVLMLPRCTREAVINAFRAGARGVFPRERSIADFLDCIRRVKDGFLWVAGQEVSFLLQAIRSLPAQNIFSALNAPSLTERELQVVQHAATGKTNKAIARELSLSEHTVKNYLFRAFEKLGVSSRIELLFYLTLTGNAPPAMSRDDGPKDGGESRKLASGDA